MMNQRLSMLSSQAAWRGHVARRAYLAWQAHLEAERAERARKLAAATRMLANWLPVFQARARFLRIR